LSSAEVVQILTLARSKVENRWVQNKAYDSYGGVCMGHALDTSLSELLRVGITMEDRQHACDTVVRMIQRRYGHHWRSIPEWNDSPTRTKGQVLAIFDEAIALVESMIPPEVEVVEKVVVPRVHTVVIPPPAPEEAPKSILDRVKDLVGV
jgi:hypothetical protein